MGIKSFLRDFASSREKRMAREAAKAAKGERVPHFDIDAIPANG
jgi:hypothetical protein